MYCMAQAIKILPALSHCSSHAKLSVDRIGHLQHTCTQSRSRTSTVIVIAESGNCSQPMRCVLTFVSLLFVGLDIVRTGQGRKVVSSLSRAVDTCRLPKSSGVLQEQHWRLHPRTPPISNTYEGYMDCQAELCNHETCVREKKRKMTHQ